MASRPAILAALLGASIGVPYVVSQATSESDGTAPTKQQKPTSSYAQPGQSVIDQRAPIDPTPVYPLAEVMRLDISKEWVYARWPRKSTGLADPQLFGVRVPLVTGTGKADLAGSLSYYFDNQGRVQHISFRGQTGDASQIVRFLTHRYNFRPVAGARPGEQLFQVMHNGKVQSELRTLPAPVLWSTSPHQSYMVELELERPGSGRYIERPLPPLTLPASPGGDGVAELKSEPPKPVPVGPITWLQQINNGLVETTESTAEALGGESKTEAASSTSSTPAEIPRPTVRWPG